MKKNYLLLIGIFCFLTQANLMSQTTLSGSVMEGSEALPGASVYFEGTTVGTQTDLSGKFTLKTELTGAQTLVVSFVGYLDVKKEVTLSGQPIDVGQVQMNSSAIGMEEVTIVASIAKNRETPVAMSTVSVEDIELANAGNELAEALNTTPAVYATKGGGGFGDSKINIRGFDQRNIAVLINGVPVNDMENGQVYWSNWAGLGDAVQTMQVQRGLGASKLAINSVGGTMNIITKGTEAEKGGSFEYSTTDYGKEKMLFQVHSGRLNKGWAFSFVGSRTTGQSYVDGTYIDAWSYFGSITKEINSKHMLQFTIIGAPQIHGQRANSQFSAQTYTDVEKRGRKYNPNWGYAKGQFLNERNNEYHKPQATLNWFYNINDKSYLSTAFYYSVGNGSGSGYLGNGTFNPGFNAVGQYQWDNVIDVNDTSTTGSHAILQKSFNNHQWAGVLSSLRQNLSDKLTLIAGLDGRFYTGQHYREVGDLLGGQYWNDALRPNAQVGDVIAFNNDASVFYTGLFGQLEYSVEKVSAYVAASVSNTNYGRTDHYKNKLDGSELKANSVNQIGYNIKGGVNYNINKNHNVFASAGLYSRAPFLEFVYLNFSNEINPNMNNENIQALEAGYGFLSGSWSIKVNGYYTAWMDKWSKTSVTDANTGARGTAYFQGLDQTHIGAELEANYQVTEDLTFGLFGSYGDWRYTKDTKATLFDDNNNPIGENQIYSKDLKVGNSPQAQIGLTANYKIWKNFILGGSYTRNEELYAQFDPASRKDPNDRGQSFKLPGYGVTNGYARINFPLGSSKGSFTLNMNNIFDVNYAMEGWDNAAPDANGDYLHGRDNFRGFWGWGRNINVALKLSF